MYDLGLTSLKLIYGTGIFLIDFICCTFLICMSKWFIEPRKYSLVTCFSAGILISASFIQLLGEAEKNPSIDTDGPAKGFPVVHFLCAMGFVLTMIVQQVMLAIGSKLDNMQRGKQASNITDSPLMVKSESSSTLDADSMEEPTPNYYRRQYKIATILFFTLIICEGLMSGITLGLQQSRSNASTMFLAIISHDWIENLICQFNLLNTIPVSSLKKRKTKFLLTLVNVFSSGINLIGICIGIAIFYKIDPALLVKLSSGSIAFTSGCFVYIASVEMIAKELPDTAHFMGFRIDFNPSEIQNKTSKARSIVEKLICTIFGFAISASVSYFFSRRE